MSTWYIDSTAIGLGDGTSWTDAYTSIITCVTAKQATSPHTYLVDDGHIENASWGGPTTLDFGTAGRSTMKSVDKTDDSYSRGALLDNSTTNTLTIRGNCFMQGTLVENQRGITIMDSTDSLNITILDGKLGTLRNSTSDRISFGVSSNSAYNRIDVIDCEIACANTSQYHSVSANSKVRISGCTYTGTTLASILGLSVDGSNIDFDNCDFNGCTNLGWDGFDTDAQNQNVTFKRCVAGSNATIDLSTGGINGNANIDIWSLKRGTSDTYHYFESVYKDCGKALESTTVKRTGGATYDGINGFSTEFQPSTNVVEFTKPLRYKLSDPSIDLSVAGGAIVEIHILLQDSFGAPVSLTDMNCVLKAVYPDAATLSLGKTVSSTTKNVLDTPSDLTSEAVTFTGTSGTTKQHIISVTIPQNASMSAAVCELWLELSVDLPATTEMFVCPLHSLG